MPNTPLIEGRWATSLAYSAAAKQRQRNKMENALTKHQARCRWVAGILASVLAIPALATTSDNTDALSPDPRHESVGELVTEFIQKSHYLHISVDAPPTLRLGGELKRLNADSLTAEDVIAISGTSPLRASTVPTARAALVPRLLSGRS